jgi:hypothetical protein
MSLGLKPQRRGTSARPLQPPSTTTCSVGIPQTTTTVPGSTREKAFWSRTCTHPVQDEPNTLQVVLPPRSHARNHRIPHGVFLLPGPSRAREIPPGTMQCHFRFTFRQPHPLIPLRRTLLELRHRTHQHIPLRHTRHACRRRSSKQSPRSPLPRRQRARYKPSSEVYGTPLTAAATNGNLEAATFLCEYMDNTTSVLQYLHNTISTCTSKRRRIDGPTLAWLMHWYLERCTKPRTIDTKKSQMIDWAIRTGDIDVLRLCYTRDQIPIWGCILSSYEFLLACEYRHVPIVQFFLDYIPCPKDPQHTCQAGRGLCAAARGGWVRACKVLPDHDGACVNSSSGVENVPALYWAVEHGKVDLMMLLLAHGAKVIRDQKRGGISMRNAANKQGGVIKRLTYKARWEQEAADEKRKAAKYPS